MDEREGEGEGKGKRKGEGKGKEEGEGVVWLSPHQLQPSPWEQGSFLRSSDIFLCGSVKGKGSDFLGTNRCAEILTNCSHFSISFSLIKTEGNYIFFYRMFL